MFDFFDFSGFEFLSPEYFLLLLIIPVIIYFDLKKRKQWIKASFINDLLSIFPRTTYLFWVNLILKTLIIFVFTLILANPNLWSSKQKISKEWIDIVIALDISTSMLSEDIKPNRIEWAKKVIWDFAAQLKTDRLWILLFAWRPFISSPLTFDYWALVEYIKSISTNTINQNVYGLNWTAIWDALLLSVNSITREDEKDKKEKKEREKVIILLSDWEANKWAPPLATAQVAKEKWIKVYTIWIWDPNGTVQYGYDMFWNKVPQTDMFWNVVKTKVDEQTLRWIADITWWQYFSASDNETFKKIFDKLSLLEKTEIKTEIIKEYTPNYKMFLYLLILIMFIYFWCKSIYQIIW